VPLILLASPEPLVSAMQIVQDAEHSVALVELQVVIVMSLWGGKEGEVVARVRVEGGGEGQAEPEPGGGHVGAE